MAQSGGRRIVGLLGAASRAETAIGYKGSVEPSGVSLSTPPVFAFRLFDAVGGGQTAGDRWLLTTQLISVPLPACVRNAGQRSWRATGLSSSQPLPNKGKNTSTLMKLRLIILSSCLLLAASAIPALAAPPKCTTTSGQAGNDRSMSTVCDEGSSSYTYRHWVGGNGPNGPVDPFDTIIVTTYADSTQQTVVRQADGHFEVDGRFGFVTIGDDSSQRTYFNGVPCSSITNNGSASSSTAGSSQSGTSAASASAATYSCITSQ
jgi:hypothetical protein